MLFQPIHSTPLSLSLSLSFFLSVFKTVSPRCIMVRPSSRRWVRCESSRRRGALRSRSNPSLSKNQQIENDREVGHIFSSPTIPCVPLLSQHTTPFSNSLTIVLPFHSFSPPFLSSPFAPFSLALIFPSPSPLSFSLLSSPLRSHECVRTGFARPYVEEDEDLLCTIFSASNYGNGGNAGAYLVFSYDPKLLLPPGGDTQEAEMQTVPDTDLHYTVLYYDIGTCVIRVLVCRLGLGRIYVPTHSRYLSLYFFLITYLDHS